MKNIDKNKNLLMNFMNIINHKKIKRLNKKWLKMWR